jgi:hypothetical protein
MSRARSLADVVPLAAAEPDGLLITTDGTYVRLIGCAQPLQPLRGGREHRDAIREQLAALAARVPAGQRLQVVVEAERIDPDSALAGDWRAVDAAAESAARDGDSERGVAIRRLGFGLEQTVRPAPPLSRPPSCAGRWSRPGDRRARAYGSR